MIFPISFPTAMKSPAPTPKGTIMFILADMLGASSLDIQKVELNGTRLPSFLIAGRRLRGAHVSLCCGVSYTAVLL